MLAEFDPRAVEKDVLTCMPRDVIAQFNGLLQKTSAEKDERESNQGTNVPMSFDHGYACLFFRILFTSSVSRPSFKRHRWS